MSYYFNTDKKKNFASFTLVISFILDSLYVYYSVIALYYIYVKTNIVQRTYLTFYSHIAGHERGRSIVTLTNN